MSAKPYPGDWFGKNQMIQFNPNSHLKAGNMQRGFHCPLDYRVRKSLIYSSFSACTFTACVDSDYNKAVNFWNLVTQNHEPRDSPLEKN
jgi:hypothetical protein